MLSAAKNLGVASEILRCAQHDMTDFAWEYSSGRRGCKRPGWVALSSCFFAAHFPGRARFFIDCPGKQLCCNGEGFARGEDVHCCFGGQLAHSLLKLVGQLLG
jgi:hypothetical protein